MTHQRIVARTMPMCSFFRPTTRMPMTIAPIVRPVAHHSPTKYQNVQSNESDAKTQSGMSGG